jgi:hypothetical protein
MGGFQEAMFDYKKFDWFDGFLLVLFGWQLMPTHNLWMVGAADVYFKDMVFKFWTVGNLFNMIFVCRFVLLRFFAGENFGTFSWAMKNTPIPSQYVG